MDMIPVASSIISAIGWDNGIMHIKFTSGIYMNIPVFQHQLTMPYY